jgi:hypothetical protein
MPKPSVTFSLDLRCVTSMKQLETAISLGPHANQGWRVSCERRAAELNASHLIPSSWSMPAPTRPAASKKGSTITLDTPAAQLFEAENRVEFDRRLRALSRSRGMDYASTLQLVTDRDKAMRELMRSEPHSIGQLFAQSGVKELNAFEHEVQLLAQRDSAVTRCLDSSLAPLKQQKVDPQGRVELDQAFNVSAYLHDPERKDRNWRRARDLRPEYADRERWEQDELMYLEAGCDLLAGLERPARVAAAHAQAEDIAQKLDGIIELEMDQQARARQLDQVIGELQDRREEVTSSTAPPTKELDRPVRDKPPTFVELTANEMTLALERYDAGGVSLDEAAAQVASIPFAKTAQDADFGPGARTAGVSDVNYADDRAGLHTSIQAYMKAHGVQYMEALTALTGVATDSPLGLNHDPHG